MDSLQVHTDLSPEGQGKWQGRGLAIRAYGVAPSARIAIDRDLEFDGQLGRDRIGLFRIVFVFVVQIFQS